MTMYPIHTLETAPPSSARQLEQAQKKLGFIPNLYAVLADAPAALESYLSLGAIFDKTSLTPTERQVVLLSVSRTNHCQYCMAAHTVVAQMQSVPAAVIEALRSDHPIADAKLEALRTFTTAVVRKRGELDAEDLDAFLDAGYSRAQILEVIAGVAMKTLSNYTNHIAETPLDNAFAAAAWSGKAAARALESAAPASPRAPQPSR